MQRYFLIKVICLWTLIITSTSAAYKDFSLGVGLINEHVGLYRTDTAGTRNKADFRVLVEAQMFLDYQEYGIVVLPRAALQFPESTEEESINKLSGYIGAGIGHFLTNSILLQVGSSYYFTYFSTEGGSSTLPNGGGGQTTDFPLPEESGISTNVTADIAMEFYLSKNYSLKTQAMIFNPLNSRNRSLSYSVMFHYYFGRAI